MDMSLLGNSGYLQQYLSVSTFLWQRDHGPLNHGVQALTDTPLFGQESATTLDRALVVEIGCYMHCLAARASKKFSYC